LSALLQETQWMTERFCRPFHLFARFKKTSSTLISQNTIHNYILCGICTTHFCMFKLTNSQSLEILVWTRVIIVIINPCGWNITKTAKRVICLNPLWNSLIIAALCSIVMAWDCPVQSASLPPFNSYEFPVRLTRSTALPASYTKNQSNRSF